MTTPIDWKKIESQTLDKLKPFQRQTVEHAFRGLFCDVGSAATRRFLVADEVGLGKTLVAKGVLVKALRQLQSRSERIDVVYICSNADIARQNIARLAIPELEGASFESQNRLTLMPLIPTDKEGNPVRKEALPRSGINFQALTPGTSLDLRNDVGQATERALLAVMVAKALPEVKEIRWRNLFAQRVDVQKRFGRLFENLMQAHANGAIDRALERRFVSALSARRPEGSLKSRLLEISGKFSRSAKFKNRDEELKQSATSLIAELRRTLAAICIKALEPDLLILDEFQRFQELLDPEGPNSDLARELFSYKHADGSHTPVLMLSATPYRASSIGTSAQEISHYDDFLAIMQFLVRDDKAHVARIKASLENFNDELRISAGGASQALQRARASVLEELRPLMSRTDRTPATVKRDAMVTSIAGPAYPTKEQMLAYRSLQQVAKVLEQPDLIEYWRSAPAPMSFLSDYKLRERLVEALAKADPAFVRSLDTPGLLLGPVSTLARNPEAGHARTAALADSLIDAGMHRLLWLAPSRPAYELAGPFKDLGDAARTKRLIFSSWRMVPRAVSTVVDGLFSARLDSENGAPAARRHEEAEGDYALGYPCSWLAGLGHPDTLARAAEAAGCTPSVDVLADRIVFAVHDMLEEVEAKYGGREDGTPDASWYWLGPLLMDAVHLGRPPEELVSMDKVDSDKSRTTVSWQPAHTATRKERLKAARLLGPMPKDLVDVLCRVAIASPAVCALRALADTTEKLQCPEVRQTAGAIAAALMHYAGHEQTVRLLEKLYPDEHTFWQRLLRYAGDGCLQSVLDEYLSVLDADQPSKLPKTATTMARLLERIDHFEQALRLRPAVLRPDVLQTTGEGAPRLVSQSHSLRHARPLLEAKGDGDSDEKDKASSMTRLRAAFNSPFLPFVLSSTSIGQEGLDFHWYCHAIVHWNLPASPVDFEQRDGRIHRYRNHAVRRNLARDWGGASMAAMTGPNVWNWMFETAGKAVATAGMDSGGMRPAWIYQEGDAKSSIPTPDWMLRQLGGAARIERHVPVIPHSRDEVRLARMTQSVAAYRLVFAQPRQEDLLAHLERMHSPDVLERLAREAVIDLTPPQLSAPG